MFQKSVISCEPDSMQDSSIANLRADGFCYLEIVEILSL